MSLLLGLVDKKIVRILTTLANNHQERFHIQSLSSRAKVPISSTFRIVNKLAKLQIIDVIYIGKFKIYRLNEKYAQEIAEYLGGKK